MPDRYARQVRFAPLGEAGQARLAQATVLVCGCGALGTVAANLLVRAGVGHVRIVDRDFVELTNLQRQVLFDEADLAAELPKAIAAANKLSIINSTVQVEPLVMDVQPSNIQALCLGVDCIVDATDNFETRFLLNDAALAYGIPWVYGGCIGSEGQVLAIIPGETVCLRCIMSEPPPAGTMATCDTAGVLAPAASIVASLQVTEVLKIVSGNRDAVNRQWQVFDLWRNQTRQIQVPRERLALDCPCCVQHDFAWLRGERTNQAAVLCGRNAVQLSTTGQVATLDELRSRLTGRGQLSGNAYLLKWRIDDYTFTFFPDGRTVIQGTDEISTARKLLAEYVGS